MEQLYVVELFAGIGAFTIGLEKAGLKTIAFCEKDERNRRVLGEHWGAIGFNAAPDAATARFSNLRGRADVVTAGFPCQDVSYAGKRGGLDGEQSRLWRHAIRALDEIRPGFAILENSPALLDGGLGDILGALAALGYDAVWHCIPAAYVGARHIRDRLWIVAYLPNAKSARFEQCWRLECEKESVEERRLRYGFAQPGPPRVADGIANRSYRIAAIGNAVVPAIPEIIGRAIMNSLSGSRT